MGLGTGLNLGLPRFKRIREAVVDGLVMFSRFTSQGKPNSISHPAEGSAEFDGSSDYIQLDTPFSYTNHTVAAWVYAEDNNANKDIFAAVDGANDGIRLISKQTEVIRYSLNGSNVTTTSTYKNVWIYVTATYDGTTQRLYIDGSQAASATTSQTISTTTDAKIGMDSATDDRYFKGNLANVAIWNRALSSDEINAVMWKGYDALTTDEKNGLQAWYKLQATEVFDATDTSTANLEKYQGLNALTFERKTALQTALTALPDQGRDRLLFEAYKTRVTTAGGTVEARNNTINEINELL